MTFADLRKEVMLLLRWHAGTLRLLKNEGDYLVALADCIGDLSETLRAYTAERSIRQDVEALRARQQAEEAGREARRQRLEEAHHATKHHL